MIYTAPKSGENSGVQYREVPRLRRRTSNVCTAENAPQVNVNAKIEKSEFMFKKLATLHN